MQRRFGGCMTDQRPLVAGVELGGTKCICVLGTGPQDIRREVTIPTTSPSATLGQIRSVLAGWVADGANFQALGIASFGPIDLDCDSATYGFITSTAKPGWRNTDVLGDIRGDLDLPLGFDTDVNGAALAEGLWGGAEGLQNFAYITVGTGIGVGLIVDGKPILGFTHAEIGHSVARRRPGDDWPGSCPYHGDCVEGLASGSAIEARTGLPGAELDQSNPAWTSVSHALGQLLHNLILTAAPQRVIMGGGVIESQQHLLPLIRKELAQSVNGYVIASQLNAGLDDYVALSSLGGKAGPLGALALGTESLRRRTALINVEELRPRKTGRFGAVTA